MKIYAKGARMERELLHFLNYEGFAVMRAPSSGGDLTPVDIIAMKGGLILAIECKAHAKKPKLDKDRTLRFKEWCEKAGAIGFLAWYNKGKWLFLRMDDIVNGNYGDENWLERGIWLGALNFR